MDDVVGHRADHRCAASRAARRNDELVGHGEGVVGDGVNVVDGNRDVLRSGEVDVVVQVAQVVDAGDVRGIPPAIGACADASGKAAHRVEARIDGSAGAQRIGAAVVVHLVGYRGVERGNLHEDAVLAATRLEHKHQV